MISIEFIKKENKNILMSYMQKLYSSDAVVHKINMETLENVFEEALSQNDNFLGFELYYNKKLAGVAFITKYFSTEVGGFTLQFEDIYIDDEYRGLGIATEYINYIIKLFDVKRYRLEVMPNNINAIHLYKKLGFNDLIYNQMIIDKE